MNPEKNKLPKTVEEKTTKQTTLPGVSVFKHGQNVIHVTIFQGVCIARQSGMMWDSRNRPGRTDTVQLNASRPSFTRNVSLI